ncbi:MAG: matrixin family metalloprotease [Gemmatimonas sp.]|nr:matrixin family metalloprotease [Gemmatimonadaceae bacterium]
MTRVALPLLSLALGASLLGAIRLSDADQVVRMSTRHSGSAEGAIGLVLGASKSDGDDHAEVRKRVHESEAGTYIGEILLERDSSLARWPDRHGIPLTVWIQPRSSVHGFAASYIANVRDAFREWDALHLPVSFAFVNDSADADVHVNWIDRFDEPISGRTRWARDDDWAITDANIMLAVHHHQGDQLDDDAMRAMALHEIGHLLGLDHTIDSLSIMAPRVRVRELSDADRATIRLLYALPAGPLR